VGAGASSTGVGVSSAGAGVSSTGVSGVSGWTSVTGVTVGGAAVESSTPVLGTGEAVGSITSGIGVFVGVGVGAGSEEPQLPNNRVAVSNTSRRPVLIMPERK